MLRRPTSPSPALHPGGTVSPAPQELKQKRTPAGPMPMCLENLRHPRSSDFKGLRNSGAGCAHTSPHPAPLPWGTFQGRKSFDFGGLGGMSVWDALTRVVLWGFRAGKKEWVSELYLERNSRGLGVLCPTGRAGELQTGGIPRGEMPRGRWDELKSQAKDAVFVCWGGAGWRDAGGGAKRKRGQGSRC